MMSLDQRMLAPRGTTGIALFFLIYDSSCNNPEGRA